MVVVVVLPLLQHHHYCLLQSPVGVVVLPLLQHQHYCQPQSALVAVVLPLLQHQHCCQHQSALVAVVHRCQLQSAMVLLMTINSAPPGLDYDRDKKFSKSFKEMVAMCLVKDQTKRPTAEKLLKHTFFKNVKPPELSIKKLFADLPSLGSRVKILQLKDAAQLASKKMPSSEQEAISQSEYQRGVSAWNFDLEDLKLQASMVQDDDEIPEIREEDESIKSNMNYKENSVSALNAGKSSLKQDIISSEQGSVGEVTLAECQRKKREDLECNKLDSDHQEEGTLKKNSSKTELPPLKSWRS